MNILVTGTPGCGKTRLCTALKEHFANLKVLNLSLYIKENKLYSSYDEKYDSYVISPKKIKSILKKLLISTDHIIETHIIDAIPSKMIDLVIHLKVPTTEILYDRLAERDYTPDKIRENVECEIMQIIEMEIYENFKKNVIISMNNENSVDFETLKENCISRIKELFINK